jgi:hypothetical protein
VYHCIQLRADPVGGNWSVQNESLQGYMFFICQGLTISLFRQLERAYQVGMFILQQVATWILFEAVL